MSGSELHPIIRSLYSSSLSDYRWLSHPDLGQEERQCGEVLQAIALDGISDEAVATVYKDYIKLVDHADVRLALTYHLFAALGPDQLQILLRRSFRRFARASVVSPIPLLRALPHMLAFWQAKQILVSSGSNAKIRRQAYLTSTPGSHVNLLQFAEAGLAEGLIAGTLAYDDSPDREEVRQDVYRARFINQIVTGNLAAAFDMSMRDEELALTQGKESGYIRTVLAMAWSMQAVMDGITLDRQQLAEHLDVHVQTSGMFGRDVSDLALIPCADAAELEATLNREGRDMRLATRLSLIAFNPIRAALLLGDLDAAASMLELRSRMLFGEVFLDHLFWCRLFLLDQDQARAAQHLRLLFDHPRFPQSRKRIEYELRIARDLPMLDALMLFAGQGERNVMSVGAGTEVHDATDAAQPAILGDSEAMRQVRKRIRTYAKATDIPVLIQGPTGTGKDLVARTIHHQSERRDEPFIAINCAAINDGLLEAELFGHIKGSYTGAEHARPGLIAAAGGGTVFLDEVGDASPFFQSALLRLLDNGEYRPVGSDQSLPVQCRFVAATNVDLDLAVKERRFRMDLLFRLQRLQIALRPLEERREDIAQLAEHFLAREGEEARTLTQELQQHLTYASWPGNIRQLRNQMELLAVHCPPGTRISLTEYNQAVEEPTAHHRLVREPESRSDLGFGTPQMARRERIMELFHAHGRLTRKQLLELLDASHATVTRDLQELCREDLIQKIEPNKSPRSHYFTLST